MVRSGRPFSGLTLLLCGLFIFLVALTALSTMLVQQPRAGEETLSNRSIHNPGKSGYKAWAMTVQKAGVPVNVWQKPFEDLSVLPAPATMVLIEPYAVARNSVLFSEPQMKALLSWVSRGNTLVLLDDFQRYGRQGSRNFLNRVNFSLKSPVKPRRGKPKQLAPLLPPHGGNTPDPMLRGFVQRPILTTVSTWFEAAESPYRWQPLLTDAAGHPTLVRLDFGKGHLILGVNVDLASNSLLQEPQADNYQFFTNLLMAEGKPLYINEYVHGYSEAQDLLAYYQQKTPLNPLALQLALVFGLVLWISFLPRKTRYADPDLQSGTGLTDYLHSLADIYSRAQAASLVLGPQLNSIETVLRKRYRTSLAETDRLRHLLGGLSGRYSGTGGENIRRLRKTDPIGDWMTVLEQAQRLVSEEKKLPHGELLKLSQHLALIQERLQYGTRTGSAGPAGRANH